MDMGLDFSKTVGVQPQNTDTVDSRNEVIEQYDIVADRQQMNKELVNSQEVDDIVSTIEINNLDSIKVNTLEVQGVKCVSCATSMDFVADSKHTNTLFDMELRAILEFYNDCYSIKIVSDNGCMEDYDNALSHDYKHIIKEIIDKLYKI